jgi:acetyl-CoA carboxylase biotin carboxyl carrier protein
MNDGEGGQGKSTEGQRGSGSPEPGGHVRRHRSRPSRPAASVNMDELRELIALIRENGFAEFELEHEGFRVRLRREGESAGAENAPSRERSAQPVTEEPAPTAATRSLAVVLAKNAAATVPSHPGAQAETAASEDQDLYIIPSPIVGTFYRAASPTAESFVRIGSRVEPDTVVCVIEAMKLMNEIQAETTGEITKIYVENGQPVEYGQPLFGIKK